jgi:hypothetical protein
VIGDGTPAAFRVALILGRRDLNLFGCVGAAVAL